MRPVRLRSSRKFWPSDFLAARPCRRITSRSGGRSSIGAHQRYGTPRDGRDAALRGLGRAARRPRREACSAAIRLAGLALAGAGDVERGAVVGRGAHERQAERDVDRMVEGQRLDRDQRLVVIHAERGVVGRARRRVEHGVGRQRPARVDAVGAQPLDRGRTIAQSSSPSAPSSPACGLRPATASRGRAMPKRSRRSRATMRPVSTIRSRGQLLPARP